MGPDTYDLVSLLRDSYVDLAEHDGRRADRATSSRSSATGCRRSRHAEWEARSARFDLMALQRNLKALGTFGYQTTAARNPVYIQYIPRTLALRAADNLARYARFGRLRELLGGARRRSCV